MASVSPTDLLKIISGFKKKSTPDTINENRSNKILSNLIEAEKGEVVVTYDPNESDYPKVFYIGGKYHSQGGTKLDIPDGSFIFSNSKDLSIKDKEVLSLFGESKPKTPAEIAKKYLFNDSTETMSNDKSDTYAKNRALNDIDNKMGMLAILGTIQEKMKGNDVPIFAKNYFITKGIDIDSIGKENKEQEGNVPKAVHGLDVNPNDNVPNNEWINRIIRNPEILDKLGVRPDVNSPTTQETEDALLQNFANNFANNFFNPDNQVTDKFGTHPANTVSEPDAKRIAETQKAGEQLNANKELNSYQKSVLEDPMGEAVSNFFNSLAHPKRTLQNIVKGLPKDININGGISLLQSLRNQAGIASSLQQMQSNINYSENNPINSDTTNIARMAIDRGDYVKAGSQYGDFRPDYQNPQSNFTIYQTPLYNLGYNMPAYVPMFKEGGETNDPNNNNPNNNAKIIAEKVFNEMQKYKLIPSNIKFESIKEDSEFKNILDGYNSISNITNNNEDFNNIMTNLQSGIKIKLPNVANYNNNLSKSYENTIKDKLKEAYSSLNPNQFRDLMFATSVSRYFNKKYNSKDQDKWNTSNDKNINNKRNTLEESVLKAVFGESNSDLINKFKINDPTYESTGLSYAPLSATYQGLFNIVNSSNKSLNENLNVDAFTGSKTGFNYIKDFSKLQSNRPSAAPQPAQQQQQPQVKYKETENPKVTPAPAPQLSEDNKKQLEDKINEMQNRNLLDEGFYKQDINNIMNAFGNIVSIKKYMPASFGWDPIIDRPVFYSPERQLQAAQQSANLSQKAIGSILPGGMAAAAMSGISGGLSEQTANIIAQTQNTNLGIANQYRQELQGLANQAAMQRAGQLQNLYNSAVIANQNYDNSLRDAITKYVGVYNKALQNKADRSVANKVYLFGSPFYIDNEGSIQFDERFAANIKPEYNDKARNLALFIQFGKQYGLSDEQIGKIVSDQFEKDPTLIDRIGQYMSTSTGSQALPSDVQKEADGTFIQNQQPSNSTINQSNNNQQNNQNNNTQNTQNNTQTSGSSFNIFNNKTSPIGNKQPSLHDIIDMTLNRKTHNLFESIFPPFNFNSFGNTQKKEGGEIGGKLLERMIKYLNKK